MQSVAAAHAAVAGYKQFMAGRFGSFQKLDRLAFHPGVGDVERGNPFLRGIFVNDAPQIPDQLNHIGELEMVAAQAARGKKTRTFVLVEFFHPSLEHSFGLPHG